jgi:hypothetical protein
VYYTLNLSVSAPETQVSDTSSIVNLPNSYGQAKHDFVGQATHDFVGQATHDFVGQATNKGR